jgi:hypothetical protein
MENNTCNNGYNTNNHAVWYVQRTKFCAQCGGPGPFCHPRIKNFHVKTDPDPAYYREIFGFHEVTSLISSPEVGIRNSSPQFRNTAYIPIDCGSAD